MSVNTALREARKAKGKTGAQMASDLGYKSKVSYYNIENEIVEVTLATAEKISKILGVPIKKLFPIFFTPKVQENQTNAKKSKVG